MQVLRIHTRDKPLAPDLALEDLLDRTRGFTGAQLESLVNEAALLAVRRARTADHDRVEIEMNDFIEGLRRQTNEKELGCLEALLVESVVHLARPRERVESRIEMQDGLELIGEVLWADAAFIKLRNAADDAELLIPKRRVRRMQSISSAPSFAMPGLAMPSWTQPIQGTV